MDESIVLDHPYLSWFNKVLKKLKTGKSPNSPMFSFKTQYGSQMFKDVAAELGFQRIGINCVYQVRHGSASTDMLDRHRSTEELMKRGRWKSLSSLRRYEQGGKLSQVFSSLTTQQQEATLKAAKDLGNIMVRSVG